jgi:hypothetical protein
MRVALISQGRVKAALAGPAVHTLAVEKQRIPSADYVIFDNHLVYQGFLYFPGVTPWPSSSCDLREIAAWAPVPSAAPVWRPTVR